MFIKYDYFPRCIKLEVSKGKWQLRFWKQFPIELIETKDKDVYFIERTEKFTDEEKKTLREIILPIDFKQLSLEEIGKLFYNDKRLQYVEMQDIEINLYNDFGVIFYK